MPTCHVARVYQLEGNEAADVSRAMARRGCGSEMGGVVTVVSWNYFFRIDIFVQHSLLSVAVNFQ